MIYRKTTAIIYSVVIEPEPNLNRTIRVTEPKPSKKNLARNWKGTSLRGFASNDPLLFIYTLRDLAPRKTKKKGFAADVESYNDVADNTDAKLVRLFLTCLLIPIC